MKPAHAVLVSEQNAGPDDRQASWGLNRCAMIATMAGISLWSVQARAQVGYVDDDAPAGGNGTAWATAYDSLQDALADARAGLITEIRVAQGQYIPGVLRSDTFGLVDNTPLRGGYRGAFDGSGLSPNDRDIALFLTTLSGDAGAAGMIADNVLTVVMSVSPTNQLLEGFDIAVGYANIVGVQRWTSRGGGLFAVLQGVNDRLTVRRCRFLQNYAYDEGGGAYVEGEGGTIVFDQCEFSQNLGSPGSGGAVFTTGVLTANFQRCGFFGNIGAVDGGALMVHTSANVVNCVFSGNKTWSGDGGAALFSDVSSVVQRVTNCSLTGNDAGGSGGGIFLDGIPPIDIVNTVLWNDTAAVGHPEVDGDPGNYVHCDIASLATAVVAGFGNFDDDPLFVDPDGPDGIVGTRDDDLEIQCGTLCVNGGNKTWYIPRLPVDYLGRTRVTPGPCGGVMQLIDVGAYELQP